MRLGIGLPTYLGNTIEPGDVLAWARRAEDAGFDAVAVHDRPDHETWDPLATLAAVAAVTERVRLATTALILPARLEGPVVKQATVIDRLSGGRLDLGVALGGREEDYVALGRRFAGRGREYERQLSRLSELWSQMIETADVGSTIGPAPIQRPRPRLWVGGYAAAAPSRAVRFGDAYLFGAPGVAAMAARVPEVRALARDAGKSDFQIGGLAYVLPSTDAGEAAEAERILIRYYGALRRPFDEMVHRGDDAALEAAVGAYRDTGLDVLHMLPVGRSPELIDRLAGLVGAMA